MTDIPTTHIVVDEPYFHTLARFGYQCISYEVAQGIVLEDVGVDMYMASSLTDSRQQLREELIAIGIDVYLVQLEGQRETLIDEKVYDGLVLFRQFEALLFYEA